MLVKTLRFLSPVCAALVLGLTLTHDLGIPGKRCLDARDAACQLACGPRCLG